MKLEAEFLGTTPYYL